MESSFIANIRDFPTHAAYVSTGNSYATKITSCGLYYNIVSTFVVGGTQIPHISIVCRLLQWGSFPNNPLDLSWSLCQHSHESERSI
jgi:hypothetical protein